MIAPNDGSHHRVAVAIRHRKHGVLYEIGALLVSLLELEGVERRLVVIAAPDVMHAALAANKELVDISRGSADVRIRRSRITFLMAAHPNAAAARSADVAGGERYIHQSAIGAVVVVSPDQALLVGEHGAPAGATCLWLRDPFSGLANLINT